MFNTTSIAAFDFSLTRLISGVTTCYTTLCNLVVLAAIEIHVILNLLAYLLCPKSLLLGIVGMEQFYRPDALSVTRQCLSTEHYRCLIVIVTSVINTYIYYLAVF